MIPNYLEGAAGFDPGKAWAGVFGIHQIEQRFPRIPKWARHDILEPWEAEFQRRAKYGKGSIREVGVSLAWDPNDKVGPTGAGAARYVMDGAPIDYVVHFENVDTASAAARMVNVVDALDRQMVDLDNFELGEVVVGTKRLAVPRGQRTFEGLIDLRPDQDLLVRVEAGLDELSGVATWMLSTIDPNTGFPPKDPLVGFLPPNDIPPEGEGHVAFSVRGKGSLASGTEIRNQAAIGFDANPVMLTPEWVNTVDATSPQSAVVGFTRLDDSTFTLDWQGSDVGSQVMDFSVFVAMNGGPFTPWLVATPAVRDTFHSQSGATYRFYSVARDSAGNLETHPGVADIVVAPTTAAADPVASRLRFEGVRPNPAANVLAVAFSLSSRSPVVIELLDVAGRRRLRHETTILGPGHHAVDLEPGRLPAGVYFVRLSAQGQVLTRKGVYLGR